MFSLKTLEFILTGTFLGLTAGISPGPVLALVINQTLKHDKREGIKVAISPLITDFPIILTTVLIFVKLSQFHTVLGIIAIAGGFFIAFLGYESVRTKGLNIRNGEVKSDSLKKGILTNFLNPHPYLFWTTIGTPYAFKAHEISVTTVILFFLSFYIMLIGSKVVVAIIVARSKRFINQKSYIIIMKLLGIALFFFSILFFYDGIKYLFIK
jgi:threonine/homoserine/homoserine lactone efflux protein